MIAGIPKSWILKVAPGSAQNGAGNYAKMMPQKLQTPLESLCFLRKWTARRVSKTAPERSRELKHLGVISTGARSAPGRKNDPLN